MIGLLLVEEVLYVLVAIAAWFGAMAAANGAIASAALRDQPGDAAAVLAAAKTSAWWFLGGVAVIAVARALTALRRGRHIRTPLLLPAALGAAALGLSVQLGYGNPFSDTWPGPAFGPGVFLGSLVAAAILVLPGDLGALVSRFRAPLAIGTAALFAALVLFGSAPGHSDARVNLGPVQPIEAVKVAVVLLLGEGLGRRAAKIRFQRDRVGVLRLPRIRLLIPAILALIGTFAGLFLVKDFGPTLILGVVFLGLFFVVTRSPGWVLLALGTIGGTLGFFAVFPRLAFSNTVETRLRMWTDPWLNGLPNGDQIAMARWALAAGGLHGSGFGAAYPGALPAGHTDLVYAHLVEELGVAGAALWLLLVGIAITDGLRVAANNRTPERSLMSAGLALLVVGQCVVIVGGTLGLIPLTGVVVPWLSFGKSGMAAFLGIAALIARFGEDGAVRADTEELRELRLGVRDTQMAVGGLVAVALGVTALRATWHRDETTLRGVVTTLADGTPVVLHDRRVASIAAAIRRGSILDRDGAVLAESPTTDTRSYPLGDALGTVLGPPSGGLLRAPWSIERQQDEKLRGYPDLPDGVAVWLAPVGGRDRLLLAAPSAANPDPGEAARAAARLAEIGGDPAKTPPRRVALASPDLSAFLPLARLPLSERGAAVQQLSADTPSRTIRLTLDAQLQKRVADLTREAAKKSRVGAAALVVLDPATGEVLARAQWPDYDPAGTDWRKLRLAADPKFMGIYGPWSDKTGAHGVWQAGSVFKLLTSIAAIRQQIVPSAAGDVCVAKSDPHFRCDTVDDGRTSFTLPGWSKPIHDHGDGGARGDVDFIEALQHSSNVYFGQLALSMGPDPFRALREAGVEFGNPGLLQEEEGPWTGIGVDGSRRLAQTGFGQGAGSWNVTQAARLAGAIAENGVYRRCPPDMLLGGKCAEIALLPDPADSMQPILSGMAAVMAKGTGAGLPKVPGIRVYGKTGTADAPGTKDEAPWGIRRGQLGQPHSWFVAIAEPDAGATEAAAKGTKKDTTLAGACDVTDPLPRRLVVAAVVPHGGYGATAAGPLAMAAVKELRDLDWFDPNKRAEKARAAGSGAAAAPPPTAPGAPASPNGPTAAPAATPPARADATGAPPAPSGGAPPR